MKYLVVILMVVGTMEVLGQTKVIHPKPLVIDLSKPKESVPKNLDKKAKKKWKALKKHKKIERKALNKLYASKIDSLQKITRQNIPGNEYLGLRMDSTTLDSFRSDIFDSLKTERLGFMSTELSRLKQKYNIPDSLAYEEAIGRDWKEQVKLNEHYTGLDSSLVDSTWLQNSSQDALTSIGLDSSYLQYQQEVLNLNDSLSNIDYLALSESLATEQLAGQFAPDLLTNEFLSLPANNEDLLSSYEDAIGAEQYQKLMSDIPGKQKELEDRINTKNISVDDIPVKPDFFAGKEKELLEAQKQLVIIKKKRSFRDFLKTLIDQDMENVKKQSFNDRFSIGGYIQVNGSKPVLIDYSPTISYKFTSRIALGIGGNGRFALGDEPTDEDDLIGYRGFLEYDIIGRIYLHGEFERTGLKVDIPGTDSSVRNWDQRWLVGLGKDFTFGPKTQGSLLILYNLNNGQDGPHGQSFQVRYGVKF